MEPIKLKKSDKYDVKVCAKCFKHEFKGKLVETPSLDDAVYDMIGLRFKDAKRVELFVPDHKKNPGINVEAEALIDDEFVVPVTIRYTICQNCAREYGQAFNAILQLRNPTGEMIKFVRSELERAKAKGVHCIKQEQVTNGIDYNMTDTQFTRHLGRLLQDKFGGELVETAKLFTRSRQTSKDLYRTTVLFRYPKFNKGDVVSYKGRDVRVINFAKKVYVEDLKTHKKEQVSYDKIK
jgi:NMD protein affecting ribosome stability and mRNA decay